MTDIKGQTLRHHIRKLLSVISVLTFIVAFFMLLLFGYWYNYPYKTLVFNDSVFPVITKTVKQGGTLKYTSKYCKFVRLPAVTSRSFANDLVFSTPEMTTDRESGCHTIIVAVPIPRELPGGKYHLENTYTYRVNPIRTIVIKHNTEDFIIIE